MKKRIFRIALVATAALAFVLSTNAKLDPSQEMSSQTRWVVNTINARHYLRGSMEQLNGAEMVEAYIESFDYGRMYFLRTEIDDFTRKFKFLGTMYSTNPILRFGSWCLNVQKASIPKRCQRIQNASFQNLGAPAMPVGLNLLLVSFCVGFREGD